MFTFYSCKSVDSDLKHSWGETTRENRDFEYQKCYSFKNKNFPASQNLLLETAKYIMKKNQKVFAVGSNLDPSKFCFSVFGDRKFDAKAEVQKRAINVNTGLIANLNSLEEFSYVIAHELAHVSMQHHLIFHPEYKPSDKFKDLKKIFDLLTNSKISADYSTSNYKLAECLSKHRPIRKNRIEAVKITSSIFCKDGKKDPGVCDPVPENYEERYVDLHPEACREIAQNNLVKTIEFSKWRVVAVNYNKEDLFNELVTETSQDENIGDAGFNWMEQEADEVGTEFYYRSGFDKSKILDFLIARALNDVSQKNSKITPQACIEYANSSPDKERLIATLEQSLKRGKGTHPTLCWRLLHLVYENNLHKKDIENISQADKSEFKHLYDLFDRAKKEILETKY